MANWEAVSGSGECVRTYEHLEELSEKLGDNVSMFMRSGYSLRQAKCYRDHNMLEEARASLQRAFRLFGLQYPTGAVSSILYHSKVLIPCCSLTTCWSKNTEDAADFGHEVNLLSNTAILELMAGRAHIAVHATLKAISICTSLRDEKEVELAFFYLVLSTTFGHLNMIELSKFYCQKCREMASEVDIVELAGWMYYGALGSTVLLYPEVHTALHILNPAFDRAVASGDSQSLTWIGILSFSACAHDCQFGRMQFICEQLMYLENQENSMRYVLLL